MCHLWPYRSVERYTDFAVRSEDRRPAYPVLVLGYDHNPIARESYYIQVLRELWRPEGEDRYDDASVVMQQQFTVCAVPDVVGLGADVVSKKLRRCPCSVTEGVYRGSSLGTSLLAR